MVEEDRLDAILNEKDEEEEEESEDVELEDGEELEELPDFDLEKLLIEGKDGVLLRKIPFFDKDEGKKKLMPIYIKPLSRGDRGKIDRAISKKGNKKSLIDLICAVGWVMDEKGSPMDISVIREVDDGVAKSIAEEIKFISGEFKDRFEDKAIDKIFSKG